MDHYHLNNALDKLNLILTYSITTMLIVWPRGLKQAQICKANLCILLVNRQLIALWGLVVQISLWMDKFWEKDA